jgi:SAM-dependent methyltransferase
VALCSESAVLFERWTNLEPEYGTMATASFKQLEHDGWAQKAGAYDDWLGPVTQQAIGPMLASLCNIYEGKRFLDICTGTGHLAAAAAERGAIAEGLDFAEPMVTKARANYPAIAFAVGDAEHLPHPAASFDVVACAFGMLHIADADAAISQAHRVLKPDGRYGFSVWCSPAQGGVFFELVLGAIQKHGTLDVDLPPAPPIFRFADPEDSRQTLTGAGFTAVAADVINLVWRCAHGEDLLAMIYKSVVRLPMLLERQTPEARVRIHRAIVEGAERHQRGEGLEIAFPAALVTATKN